MVSILRKIIPIVIVFGIFSCKKTFKQADDAFFLTADQINFKTEPGQGYGSHKITDMWVYTNGFFRGAYPIGSKMPIMLKDGKAVIDIFAGIKNNGISSTRINWLLYEPIKIDTTVAAGENITRNFTFKYKSSVQFIWLENFELPGFSLVKSSVSDTTFKIHTNDSHVFEGNKSIEFGLTGSAIIAQLESAISYSLPMSSGSGNVYLELDHKGNSDFIVSVMSSGQLTDVLVVTKSESWDKIYIQLSNAINADPSTGLKKIVFKIIRNQGISEQKVYLDNIKLVNL